jgi:hypothetical protein
MLGIVVRPTNGLTGLLWRRMYSVSLRRKICRGGEDAARDQVSFNIRKPKLDLIEPGL